MSSYVLFNSRNLEKEVESYQNKVERKTGQSVTKSEENVCEICHKTKFTDGSGKECKYCKLKVCARCGVQVTIPGSKQVNFANSLNVLNIVKILLFFLSVIHVFLFSKIFWGPKYSYFLLILNEIPCQQFRKMKWTNLYFLIFFFVLWLRWLPLTMIMFTGYGKSEYNFNLPLLHLTIQTLELEIFKTIRCYAFLSFW